MHMGALGGFKLTWLGLIHFKEPLTHARDGPSYLGISFTPP